MKGKNKVSVDINKSYDIKLEAVNSEPSDVNWENQNIPLVERAIRWLIATLIVTVFLCISIGFTVFSQSEQIKMMEEMSFCNTIYAEYGEENNGAEMGNLPTTIG